VDGLNHEWTRIGTHKGKQICPRITPINAKNSVKENPANGAAVCGLGSTGCQPVVVGSLPTTQRFGASFGCELPQTSVTSPEELFGKLPKRTG
jgi:hypothetical protein